MVMRSGPENNNNLTIEIWVFGGGEGRRLTKQFKRLISGWYLTTNGQEKKEQTRDNQLK